MPEIANFKGIRICMYLGTESTGTRIFTRFMVVVMLRSTFSHAN